MPNHKKFVFEENKLREVLPNSESFRDVLDKLNYTATSAAYVALKTALKKFNLDYSHFLGQGFLLGKKHNWKKSKNLNDILSNNITYVSSNNLKKRLIKDGVLENKCQNCKIDPIWNNNPLSLQLDHINGIHSDNSLENLRLLCPNCHSQTETFAGKNHHKKKEVKIYECKKCFTVLKKKRKSEMCRICCNKYNNITT
jgi:Zn finger protein HypA/HybF involved in hydrogenase expression